jgi:hypothetical protein
MDYQTVPAANGLDESVWARIPGLVHITFLVEVVIHPVTAMYDHRFNSRKQKFYLMGATLAHAW